ncbi:MAG: prepilin-type N-terminal cleavage/methylation domain-containing protein [Pseudomonadota bacterium]
MNRVHKMAQQGFTLVELLIVVIILALLAAIVVPQFASSTDDAKISSLDTTLSNMRGAIDLYYQQHSSYPGKVTAVSTYACAGTAGTGDGGLGNEALTFQDQMSMYTATNGMACSTKDTNHKYGPYLKKRDLPDNPVTGVGTFAVVTAGDLNMNGDNVNLGWKYDNTTGKFIANDTTLDPDGVAYDKH